MTAPLRLLLAFAPFLLTALFGWLVMDGYLNLGSGDKDIFVVVPLLLWSLVYLCCYVALWWYRTAPGRAFAWSASLATGFVVIAWLILLWIV